MRLFISVLALTLASPASALEMTCQQSDGAKWRVFQAAGLEASVIQADGERTEWVVPPGYEHHRSNTTSAMALPATGAPIYIVADWGRSRLVIVSYEPELISLTLECDRLS